MSKISKILGISKTSAISKILSFIIVAAMLCGMFTFTVSAADPIVFDFSKYNYVEDIIAGSTGGQGEFDIINDGDRRVLFAECTDGYVPEDDPEGTGTMGDLYTTINDIPDYNIDADAYQWIKMSVKNESAAPFFEIHYDSPSRGLHVETSVNFEITPNSDYTTYVYHIPTQSEKYYPKRPADVDDPDNWPNHWTGILNQFRLDFMYYEESGGHAKTGDKIYIEYIAFFDSEKAANDFTFAPARTALGYDAEMAAIAEAAAAEAEAAATAETEAPTEPPVDEPTDTPEIAGDETTDTTASTEASSDTDSDDNNNMMIIIIIAAVVVVAVIVVIVVVSGKNKGKK